MVNDCGSDGADDVSAPKQPGEIPGVSVLMKREEGKTDKRGDVGDFYGGRRRPTDWMKERKHE